jgi:hypothetical protein
MATIDLDGSATELTKPPVKAVAIPAAATSASSLTRAHDRAATDTPTAIVSLVKKPVALDSFVQKPAAEEKPALPKPRANEKLAAHSSAAADRTPELLPKASFEGKFAASSNIATDRTPELLPRASITRKSATFSNGTNGKAAVPPSEAKPVGGAPKVEGNRLPSPLQTPRSMPVVAPPVVAPPAAAPPAAAPSVAPPVLPPQVAGVQPVKERLPTEVANPPPPPIVIAGSSARKTAEATQLVTPLPSPLATRVPRAPTPPVIVEPGLAEIEPIAATGASRSSWIAAGLLSAMAITAVVLIVVSGSSGDDVLRAKEPVANEPAAARSSEVKPLPSQPAVEPPRPERTARSSEPPPPPEPPRPERTARNSEPPPPPEPPRPERTARNSEPPPATEVAAQEPAEPPPSNIPAPPRNAITPPASEATPARRPSPPPAALAPSPLKRATPPSVTHKPVQVAKPVAKPPVKTQPKPPAKSIKQPAYDPDALFLKP